MRCTVRCTKDWRQRHPHAAKARPQDLLRVLALTQNDTVGQGSIKGSMMPQGPCRDSRALGRLQINAAEEANMEKFLN